MRLHHRVAAPRAVLACANEFLHPRRALRNHSLEQRLARWLLMMRERVSGDRLELTQHFLGAMLGVRRAGVNEAAGTLQRRKLIRLGRGSMQILDRTGVEAAACACYQALKIT